MKKKTIYIILYMLLLISVIGSSITISLLHSPEYALVKIMRDVERSGLEGLRLHLTGEIGEIVETTTKISDNAIMNTMMSAFRIDDSFEMLQSEISEIEWSVENILKGKGKANVYLRFNYKDKFSGIVELKLVYEEHEWKINKAGLSRLN